MLVEREVFAWASWSCALWNLWSRLLEANYRAIRTMLVCYLVLYTSGHRPSACVISAITPSKSWQILCYVFCWDWFQYQECTPVVSRVGQQFQRPRWPRCVLGGVAFLCAKLTMTLYSYIYIIYTSVFVCFFPGRMQVAAVPGGISEPIVSESAHFCAALRPGCQVKFWVQNVSNTANTQNMFEHFKGFEREQF